MSVPAGFQAHASGLLVPEAHARTRRVVTHEQWRAIDKALSVMNQLGLRMQFRCEQGCPSIAKIAQPDGGTVLRCDCTDRVFTKAF